MTSLSDGSSWPSFMISLPGARGKGLSDGKNFCMSLTRMTVSVDFSGVRSESYGNVRACAPISTTSESFTVEVVCSRPSPVESCQRLILFTSVTLFQTGVLPFSAPVTQRSSFRPRQTAEPAEPLISRVRRATALFTSFCVTNEGLLKSFGAALFTSCR